MFDRAALASDNARQPVADLQVFVRAASLNTKPPLKSQRQAHVEKFQQINVLAGLLLQSCEQVIEPVAADGFFVKRAHHGLHRPRGLPAPWGVEHNIIKRGADRISRNLDCLGIDPCLERPALEVPDLGHNAGAQLVRVAVLGAVADAADQGK